MENKEPIQTSPYPVDLLPRIISDAVKEVSQNLKIPTDLAAHAALSAISTACQGRINVKFPNFPASSCGLFLWVVSDASRGKSIANERFFRSIAKFEEEYNQQHTVDERLLNAQVDAWQIENTIIKNELKNTKRGTDDFKRISEELILHGLAMPSKNKHKTICHAQVTPQKLHDILVNDGVAAIISPEAGHLILSPAFSQPGILSSFWSGEDQSMGLIKGDRKPYHPRLTISIMTQSNPFHDFMVSRGKLAFSSGLLSRFLVSFPSSDNAPEDSVSIVNEMPEPKLDKFNHRIYEIVSKEDVSLKDRATLYFSDSGKAKFEIFKQQINSRIKNLNVSPVVETFYRRLIQHASRMAALWQYFCSGNEAIEDYVTNAIELCIWYGLNYDRIFSKYLTSDVSDGEQCAQILHGWLEKAYSTPLLYPRLKKGVYSFRDLQNYAGFKGKAEKLTEAINILEARKLIKAMSGKKGALVILYPFQEQVVYPISNILGSNEFYPSRPPFPYATGPVIISSPSLDINTSAKNYQEVATNSVVVTVNGAINNTDLEYVQKELQERANKESLGNITISAGFVKNNS